MNEPSSLKGIFDDLEGSLHLSSFWEIGWRIILLSIALLIIAKIIPIIHKKLYFFKFYQQRYDQYQGWLEFIGFLIILVLFFGQLEQLPWKSALIFGGVALVSLGLSFKEVLINIIAYPIVKRTIRIKRGDYIGLGEYNGKLIKLGLTHINLLAESEKIITIPNRKVLTETFMSNESKQNTYHFEIEFPVPPHYQNNLSKLLELCHEAILLSAYRSLSRPPEIKAILKDGALWLKCVCYTNREKNLSPYRTFLLTELAEKTSILDSDESREGGSTLLKDPQYSQILSQKQNPRHLKYGEIEKTFPPTSQETLPDNLETQDGAKEIEAESTPGVFDILNVDEVGDHPSSHQEEEKMDEGLAKYTISDIENLENMDLLYEFAMSPDPEQANAAMVAIERLQKEMISPKKETNSTMPSEEQLNSGTKAEFTEEKDSKGRPSTIPPEEKSNPDTKTESSEIIKASETDTTKIKQINDIDQLYELAMSDDPAQAEAAMQAIEKMQRELVTKKNKEVDADTIEKEENLEEEKKRQPTESRDIPKEENRKMEETLEGQEKAISSTNDKQDVTKQSNGGEDSEEEDEILLLVRPEMGGSGIE